ncbi:hypothetical protein GCM10020331_027160 [Ectobacillus funiculus]
MLDWILLCIQIKIIHFDYDYTFIGKSIPVATQLVLGDAKHNLESLLKLIKTDRLAKPFFSKTADTY